MWLHVVIVEGRGVSTVVLQSCPTKLRKCVNMTTQPCFIFIDLFTVRNCRATLYLELSLKEREIKCVEKLKNGDSTLVHCWCIYQRASRSLVREECPLQIAHAFDEMLKRWKWRCNYSPAHYKPNVPPTSNQSTNQRVNDQIFIWGWINW